MVLTFELGASFHHKLAADDIADDRAGRHDLYGLTAHVPLHLATDYETTSLHVPFDETGQAHGYIALGMNLPSKRTVNMELRRQAQFADELSPLRDNRGSELTTRFFIAFAKESHGTRSSVTNSVS